MSEPSYRCGTVAIAGLPNAGKSTLLNALVGEKVAIVAPKPQTTRTAIQGVRTLPEAQIIFIDTPGIHRSDTYLQRRMMGSVRQALDSPDLRLYVTDVTRPLDETEWEALDTLRRAHRDQPRPSILVLNKIDRLDDKRQLLPRMNEFSARHPFEELVPVSALQADGLDELLAAVVRHLPVGEAIFPPDYLTDQPERYLAAEMIREQILLLSREEVPHATAVRVEQWEEKPQLTRIAATIIVERPGQKAILIGQRGQMLKKIGSQARAELEAFFGRKVFLELFVTVKEKWRTNEAFVNQLDWRINP